MSPTCWTRHQHHGMRTQPSLSFCCLPPSRLLRRLQPQTAPGEVPRACAKKAGPCLARPLEQALLSMDRCAELQSLLASCQA